ncbi:MAG: Gfo/Idh/MocA family oxidoreductase [Pseudomonadales bacterium]|jgi:predicted dehydrogenase|nr:Gfo/Idh/MocA family oxidoreductase [Pseudomonadales bacterium]
MSIKDGANYAPNAKLKPVVRPGEFRFAAAFLDHGHIYGQTNGLLAAGGTLTHVYDPDRTRLAAFAKRFPEVQTVSAFETLLDDGSLDLIASAAVPNRRGAIGETVMQAGKHYFTDKSPFTTLGQLNSARDVCSVTGQRYFVYYAERVHNEAAWHAGEIIAAGDLGRVLQVITLAPHRLAKDTRPSWFFDKAAYGGIITDIGSHQVEQFLAYADCRDARVNFARVENFGHPDRPGLEDFGEFGLQGDNGASLYSRVDWYTPDGMPVWGDGRTFVLGTKGTLEVRKYLDLGRQAPAGLVLKADDGNVETIDCRDSVGYPFFGLMILDALNGTERAMTQDHIFKAAELSMQAQAHAHAHGTMDRTA